MFTILDLPSDTIHAIGGSLRKDLIANVNKARNYPGKADEGRLVLLAETLQCALDELERIHTELFKPVVGDPLEIFA